MERPSTTLHAAAVDGDASGVVVVAEAYATAQFDPRGGNAVHMGLAKLTAKPGLAGNAYVGTLHMAAVDGDASGVADAAKAYVTEQYDPRGGNASLMGVAKLLKKLDLAAKTYVGTLHAAAVDGDASGVVVAAEAYTFAQCDSHGGNAVHMQWASQSSGRSAVINSPALLFVQHYFTAQQRRGSVGA